MKRTRGYGFFSYYYPRVADVTKMEEAFGIEPQNKTRRKRNMHNARKRYRFAIENRQEYCKPYNQENPILSLFFKKHFDLEFPFDPEDYDMLDFFYMVFMVAEYIYYDEVY